MSLNSQIETTSLPKFSSELEKKVFYRFVEMRAHQIWIANGRPEGQSAEQWKQAELEMTQNWRGEYFPRLDNHDVVVEKRKL
jgi:hypothetical protein